ncbi:hypothetical protein K435DRAFT_874047 [Dendrothele bispora CBS 962.96]|uniref:Uncharacterized protein n=1 Tax=Dendrothele bispora (strain CBS 962.96) TaxID=1314807 RepID=A0A4S8KXU9_DENBC|nr:hypothetical protein K435DRAFT_874047 [Dendrothele bispora CBS 962.96]
MSAFDTAFHYRPGDHDSDLFHLRRQDKGLYDYLVGLITSRMEKSAFANVTPGEDFVRAIRPASRGYGYMEKDGRPFNCNVFGEILGPRHGTLMSARYNHFPGEDRFNPIPLKDSNRSTKGIIVIGCPSLSSPALTDAWHNQLTTAVELREYDAKWERETNSVPRAGAKEFVKNTNHPKDPDVAPDCMVLTGPPMYMVPPQGTQSAPPKTSDTRVSARDNMKKRRIGSSGESVSVKNETSGPLTSTDVVAPSNASNASGSVVAAPSTATSLKVYPSGDQIFVGATYEPYLQHDYGGKSFDQVHARLVQPDFRDVSQRLICPWDFYDKLRPGTLIMANVDISVFVMDGRKARMMPIYHANILSLRVLGESDVPVDKPRPYQTPSVVPSGPSGESFNNFEIPDFQGTTGETRSSTLPDFQGTTGETRSSTPLTSWPGTPTLTTEESVSAAGTSSGSSSDTIEENVSTTQEEQNEDTMMFGEDVLVNYDILDTELDSSPATVTRRGKGKGKKAVH